MKNFLSRLKTEKFFPYIGVDMISRDWVGGEDYFVVFPDGTVWFRKVTRDKRGRVIKRERTAWILPETLHRFNGLLEDGRPDYVRENLSWCNWPR